MGQASGLVVAKNQMAKTKVKRQVIGFLSAVDALSNAGKKTWHFKLLLNVKIRVSCIPLIGALSCSL